MARTRWPPGPVNPGLLPRPGRSDRQRRWVPENLGPGRQSDIKTTRAAPADSEVRPGPRPPTLRPHQAKTTEAGPEAEKQDRKHYPHPPCRIFTAGEVLDRRCCSVQISPLWRGSSVSPPRRVATGLGRCRAVEQLPRLAHLSEEGADGFAARQLRRLPRGQTGRPARRRRRTGRRTRPPPLPPSCGPARRSRGGCKA
jgi:hypothetical protein